jgi:hypothetical protein
MEEKIFKRQVNKLAVSCGVSDDDHQTRQFNSNEIEDIYDDSQIVVLEDTPLVSHPGPMLQSSSNSSTISDRSEKEPVLFTSTLQLANIGDELNDDVDNISRCNSNGVNILSHQGQSLRELHQSHDHVLKCLGTTKESKKWLHEIIQIDSLKGPDEIELTEEDFLRGEAEFENESTEMPRAATMPMLHAAFYDQQISGYDTNQYAQPQLFGVLGPLQSAVLPSVPGGGGGGGRAMTTPRFAIPQVFQPNLAGRFGRNVLDHALSLPLHSGGNMEAGSSSSPSPQLPPPASNTPTTLSQLHQMMPNRRPNFYSTLDILPS